MFSRILLSCPDGTYDTTTDVEWIQGEAFYCDLRQSVDGEAIEGFAGPLVELEGTAGVVEWIHSIDLASEPASSVTRDAGRFVRLGAATVAEHGHFEDYLEHWRITLGPEVGRKPGVREYALTESSGSARGFLVQVGHRFGFAYTDPRGSSEVSLGTVEGDVWRISRSSRAARVGTDLAAAFGTRTVTVNDMQEGRGCARRSWLVDSTPRPNTKEAPVSTFTEIPTIDVSGLRSADPIERQAVAEELGRAAREVGFAQVIGHGVSAETFDAMLTVTKEFFALPEEKKMEVYIGNSTNHRGYVPVGEEVFAGATPDLKEAYDLSIDLPEDYPAYLQGNPLLGPNQWPDLTGFTEKVDAYYHAVFELGTRILRGFALALGLPEDRFDRLVSDPPSQLRLIHYPHDPSVEDRPGIGAHTDYEAFTLLRPTTPGLEVMNGDGEWIDVPFREDALVLNTGDLLEILTNGDFVATAHRVRKVAEERYSFPLFFNFDYEIEVAPLPELVGDGVPRYEPVRAGDHLFAQTAQSFVYLRRRQEEGSVVLPEGSRPLYSLGREARLG